MQNCDLLITADYIVTQNQQREVLEKAAIAISGSSIEAIGPVETLETKYAPAVRRDLGRALVLPGLVNAHTHAPMTLLRGLADDLPLMEWLTGHIFPREAKLTPQMLEVGTLLGCAEMLRSGTTACADMYLNEAHIYRAIHKSGMRALVSEGTFAFPSIGCAEPTKIFEIIREQAAEVAALPRLRYAVAPHSVYTTNMDILEKCAALAEALNLPIHTHLAETASETAQCLKMYGCRPAEVCRRAGIFGVRTLIAHGVVLLPEEIEMLSSFGVSSCHCPRSNMKLASGISPVPQMLEAGMNVALGTDGASSNNMLNMFLEMSAAALLHKVNMLDPTVMPAQTLLDMATLNGARAIGWPEVGSLKPGAPADLTALDLTAPNLSPLASPISQLVYATTGHEVFLTMIDGKILYDNGKFPGFDYPALLAEAQSICCWLRRQD